MNLLSLPSLPLIGMVGSAAAAALTSWWITHAVDTAALNHLKLADARAQAEALATQNALQVDLGAIGVKVSTEFEAVREHATYLMQTITKEIPIYVSSQSDTRYPLPWGLVRVHDAAVAGVDPAALSIPPGQSDNSAAPVKASDLAANDVENFGTCHADAEQLARVLEWAKAVETDWNSYRQGAKDQKP